MNVPYILCALPADVTPVIGPPPPGSKLRPCCGCGEKVILSPSTLAHVARSEFRPVCRRCCPAGRGGRPVVHLLTADGARELTSWLAHDPATN